MTFFIIFAKLKKIDNMKKLLVILALIFVGILTFSACESQHKCAAYGYYSEYNANANDADNAQL